MHYFPFCCGVPLDTCMPLDTLFFFSEKSGLMHNWTCVSRCEKLMHAETVFMHTLEFKGDILGETQQEFFMFCGFPACSLCSCSKPHWTATLRLFFFSYGSSHFSWALCCHGFCCNFTTPLDFFGAALQSPTPLFPERHVAVNWGKVSVGKWKEWWFKQTSAPFQRGLCIKEGRAHAAHLWDCRMWLLPRRLLCSWNGKHMPCLLEQWWNPICQSLLGASTKPEAFWC